MMSEDQQAVPDFIEKKTEELLKKAKRSGYFREVIEDAKYIMSEERGYVWDVALAISCGYWCS